MTGEKSKFQELGSAGVVTRPDSLAFQTGPEELLSSKVFFKGLGI